MLRVGPGVADALIDTEDGVVVGGAAPGATVRLEARLELGGQAWSCFAEYVADAAGVVDTSRDPSLAGDYEGVDPFGLFWSADTDDLYADEPIPVLQVSMRALSGTELAQASYVRVVAAPGVTVAAVREAGVIGRVHRPTAVEAPSVVILSGSGGGLGGGVRGALLASHGVSTLSLAHWNYPGTPPVMRDIDVEVVGAACDWLRRQPGVVDRPPAVLGISRGGELALLAGALLGDRVGPVISDVGSGVPWGAYGTGTDVREQAWRFAGEPVTQMREDPDDPNACLDDPEQVAAAEIPIERCHGPVLLISGEDDQMWDSTRLSDLALRRAERLGVTDRVTHLRYADAGHGCGVPPGFAVPSVIGHPVDGGTYPLGGTREGNHAARLDAWRHLLTFVGG